MFNIKISAQFGCGHKIMLYHNNHKIMTGKVWLFLAAIAALYLGSSLTDSLTDWLTGTDLGQSYKLVKT